MAEQTEFAILHDDLTFTKITDRENIQGWPKRPLGWLESLSKEDREAYKIYIVIRKRPPLGFNETYGSDKVTIADGTITIEPRVILVDDETLTARLLTRKKSSLALANEVYRAEMRKDFTSKALGYECVYHNDAESIQYMLLSFTVGRETDITCRVNDVWIDVKHGISKLGNVLRDSLDAKDAAKSNFKHNKDFILNKVTTIRELDELDDTFRKLIATTA